jgi:hypothetical protein
MYHNVILPVKSPVAMSSSVGLNEKSIELRDFFCFAAKKLKCAILPECQRCQSLLVFESLCQFGGDAVECEFVARDRSEHRCRSIDRQSSGERTFVEQRAGLIGKVVRDDVMTNLVGRFCCRDCERAGAIERTNEKACCWCNSFSFSNLPFFMTM